MDLSFILSFGIGVTALVVTIIALFIAIIISRKQDELMTKNHKLTDEIRGLTDKIHKNTTEQSRLLADTREFYAGIFVRYVQTIAMEYKKVISIYNNEFSQVSSEEHKEKIREKLYTYYDAHLITYVPEIGLPDLVKVFGRGIADPYWRHVHPLKSDWWRSSDDTTIRIMMEHYTRRMYGLVELKDMFLLFCDEADKENDGHYEEDYRSIKQNLRQN